MKEQFNRHKKKIIIGLITIISYFFAPAAMVVPVLDSLIDADTISEIHEGNISVKK